MCCDCVSCQREFEMKMSPVPQSREESVLNPNPALLKMMSIQRGGIGNGMKQLNDDSVDLNRP